MNLNDLIQIVDGKLLNTNAVLEQEINGCGGADLMSDVLASLQPESVLLTGLCNPQVVRTAQLADIMAIVLVRGKTPPPETVTLADEENVPLIGTPFGMFEACGRLYQAGIRCMEKPVVNSDCTCE